MVEQHRNQRSQAVQAQSTDCMHAHSIVQVVMLGSGVASSSNHHPASPSHSPATLHLHTITCFELWLAHRQAQHMQSQQQHTPAALNECMRMLTAAAAKGAQLAEDGCNMSSFEDGVLGVRSNLEAAAAASARRVAQHFELQHDQHPDSTATTTSIDLSSEAAHNELPGGTIPPSVAPAAGAGGLDAARARAAANLGSLPQLPLGSSPSAILAWLQRCEFGAVGGQESLLLRLKSVERELFSRCALWSAADADRCLFCVQECSERWVSAWMYACSASFLQRWMHRIPIKM